MPITNYTAYLGKYTPEDIDNTIELAVANANNITVLRTALEGLVPGVGKNLAPVDVANGTTSNGITATVNADGSITLSGTADSSKHAAIILFGNTPIKAGTYVFSGCPSGGSAATYRIDVVVNETTVYRDTGNSVQFTLSEDSQVRAQIAIYKGTAAPSAPFKPMLCTKADWDASQEYEPAVPVGTAIVLEVGQGKTYTSLRTALEYATSNYNDNITYEVRLYDEEYDVANDLTQEELTTASTYPGLMVTKNVRLVGANNYRKCVIKLELSDSLDSTIRQRISTINIKDNATLENLTIEAAGCRYAVHDDYYSETDRKKTIKNCKFYSDGTYYHRAYGAGYRSGDDFTFENCVFEMTDTQQFAPFSAHNNVGFTKPANLTFVNCRFSGGTYGAMFGTLAHNQDNTVTTDVVNTVTFIGCKTSSEATAAVRLYEESAATYGTGCLVAVTGFGNTFDDTDVLIQTTDSQDYSDRVDLI